MQLIWLQKYQDLQPFSPDLAEVGGDRREQVVTHSPIGVEVSGHSEEMLDTMHQKLSEGFGKSLVL